MRCASICLTTVFLIGCHGTSARLLSYRCLSPEAEALAGARAAPAVEARHGGIVRDAQVEQRLERIGQRLCSGCESLDGEYRFRLLGSSKMNAASLPGGRVYITRGLYDRLESDDQVAAVLAHEIAHIQTKDHFKTRCASTEEAIDREADADWHAALYLREAGIPPQAMIEVIRIIATAQPMGWSDTRIRSLVARLQLPDAEGSLAQN